MLALPFFWDQPALAKRCEELGLSMPLADRPGPLARLTVDEVRQRIVAVMAARDRMQQRLVEARRWEMDAVSGRGRIAALILSMGGPAIVS
jgi:hypothetical protein